MYVTFDIIGLVGWFISRKLLRLLPERTRDRSLTTEKELGSSTRCCEYQHIIGRVGPIGDAIIKGGVCCCTYICLHVLFIIFLSNLPSEEKSRCSVTLMAAVFCRPLLVRFIFHLWGKLISARFLKYCTILRYFHFLLLYTSSPLHLL